MAVIVQRDIKPHVAGVMFTCDPLTGAREPIVQFEGFCERSHQRERACREIRLRDLSGVAGEEDVPPLLTDHSCDLQALPSVYRAVLGTSVGMGRRPAVPVAGKTNPRQRRLNHQPWAFEEELSRIYKLDLGKCGDRLIKELRKKIWFRLFCLRKVFMRSGRSMSSIADLICLLL